MVDVGGRNGCDVVSDLVQSSTDRNRTECEGGSEEK